MVYKIAVFSSSGGGNFQSLIDNQEVFGYKVSLLIADRECRSINKAINANIPFVLIKEKKPEEFFKKIKKEVLKEVNLIVFAGFLKIAPKWFCKEWSGKIINIHPSLLPKFGGKGMYGEKVHKAIICAKEKYTGCTVHFVNENVDEGKIILQKRIEINDSWTPWELGGKVFEEEVKLLPYVVGLFAKGKIHEK